MEHIYIEEEKPKIRKELELLTKEQIIEKYFDLLEELRTAEYDLAEDDEYL